MGGERTTEAGGQPRRRPSGLQDVLARPDVALVPIGVTGIAGVALAVGQLLRPDGEMASSAGPTVVIAGSIFVALLCALLTYLAQRTPVGQRVRGDLSTYALAAAFLMVLLAIAAILDRGLATVALASVTLAAFHSSFVFPLVVARLVLGGLAVSLAIVGILGPPVGGTEFVALAALVAAGWALGRIPRSAHRLASRHALVLSRSDQLTRALNRRGFLEELAWELRCGARERRPFALLVIDLNGFKRINDSQGHAAGDELLAWVGRRIPTVLPEGASFGRLGGDEFAVALPGATEAAAEALGRTILATLSERVGASIGIAARTDGGAAVDALVRAADGALYAAKADPMRRVQVREADPASGPVEPDAPHPPLTHADLRRAPVVDEGPGLEIFSGRWMMGGYAIIAISGLAFVVATWLFPGDEDSVFTQLIAYGGIPWVLLNLTLAAVYHRGEFDISAPTPIPFYMSAILVGSGVGAAALSTGDGITSPIMAGFYLKLLFDAAIFERGPALQLTAIMAAFWVAVVALGPADALWAVPFQLVLLAGAFRLGSIGRDAFDSATRARMKLALTDPLTGLLNRRGFMSRADRIMATAVSGVSAPAVISLDLDDFKAVNDSIGHSAGDDLLVAVGQACRAELGDAYFVGRLGGDEFVAISGGTTASELARAVAGLDRALGEVVAGSIGGAIFGPDGVTLDQLLQVADSRAYAVKEARVQSPPAGDVEARRGGRTPYEGPERRRGGDERRRR